MSGQFETEAIESQAEQGNRVERTEFSVTEQNDILNEVNKLYKDGKYLGSDEMSEAISDEQKEEFKKTLNALQLKGVDITKADALGTGISPQEYAGMLIRQGKPKAESEITMENGEKVQTTTTESLVATVNEKNPLEFRTQNSTIKIKAEGSSKTGFIAEIYSENGVQVDKKELGTEGISISRPEERNIVISVREKRGTSATIQISQEGTDLKGLNGQN